MVASNRLDRSTAGLRAAGAGTSAASSRQRHQRRHCATQPTRPPRLAPSATRALAAPFVEPTTRQRGLRPQAQCGRDTPRSKPAIRPDHHRQLHHGRERPPLRARWPWCRGRRQADLHPTAAFKVRIATSFIINLMSPEALQGAPARRRASTPNARLRYGLPDEIQKGARARRAVVAHKRAAPRVALFMTQVRGNTPTSLPAALARNNRSAFGYVVWGVPMVTTRRLTTNAEQKLNLLLEAPRARARRLSPRPVPRATAQEHRDGAGLPCRPRAAPCRRRCPPVPAHARVTPRRSASG